MCQKIRKGFCLPETTKRDYPRAVLVVKKNPLKTNSKNKSIKKMVSFLIQKMLDFRNFFLYFKIQWTLAIAFVLDPKAKMLLYSFELSYRSRYIVTSVDKQIPISLLGVHTRSPAR